MKIIVPPPATSEVRRVLAPYFELARDLPELYVSVPDYFPHEGIDYPLLKARLIPDGNTRSRLLIISGLSPFDRGSSAASFQALLRLLQNRSRQSHVELVIFPLANPVALAAGAPLYEDETRAALSHQLSAERYDGIVVLHDDPASDGLSFRLPAEESSLDLAADLLRGFGHSYPTIDVWKHGGGRSSGGRFVPLDPGDFEPLGSNEGSAFTLHALLPSFQGSRPAASTGAKLLLDLIDELAAVQSLGRQPVRR